MEFYNYCFILVCTLLSVKFASPQGPVFVNPNAPAAAAFQTTSANQGNYVTQTVYGFLDFTTTIGNTIMVFSPQSSAVPQPAPTKSHKDILSNNIIDTKPLETKEKTEIKPSKSVWQDEKIPSEKKTSTVVNVRSQAAPSVSTKVEVKTAPITKVNIVEGKPSSSIPHPPLVVSKVQVVEASSSKLPSKQNVITKVEIIGGSSNELPKHIIASKVKIHTSSSNSETAGFVSKVVQIKSDDEPATIIGNHIGEPEFADFLSRQPSEIVEESYRVVNLKPSSKFILKHRPSEAKKNVATKRGGATAHPTGLVTKLGGTVVKDGITTIIETSVIGTYISGKYAQVLQSSSRKINPTQSLRVLKTAAPTLGKGSKFQHQRHIDPTPSGVGNEEASLTGEGVLNGPNTKSSRKSSGNGASFKRLKNRHKESEISSEAKEQEITPQSQQNVKKSHKSRSQSQATRKHDTSTQRPQKGNRKRKPTTTSKPSVHSEEVTTAAPSGKRFSGRRNKQNKVSNSATPPITESSGNSYTRRGFKPKVQPSTVEKVGATTSSLYKFKLNRSPGRWQYKTTSKPRVTIRKQNGDETLHTNNNETLGATSPSFSVSTDVSHGLINEIVTPESRSDDVDSLEGSESIASIIDDESSSENKLDKPAFPIETIKVEISTPPDFTDIYYEIATIKSPYTFQVGNLKNTRYVTVTSTFEKSFEPTSELSPTKALEPLTENILASTSNYAKDNNFLDSSLATLPPLYLASDVETPPLETLTETFSTTQTMLKTHILPVVRFSNETISSTLVQTYVITRLVTATKTLPPMDAYQFNPSRTLNEFNSHLDEAGSELHLELEFGDSNEQDDGKLKKLLPADLDLANIGSQFDLSDVDKNRLLEAHLRSKKAQSPPKQPFGDLNSQALNPEQLQQLALYRLLNPGTGQGQIVTTSKPIIKVETLYDTFVLPVTQGHNTVQSTISKIKGTITKTDYEFGTSTIAPALPIGLPQMPQQIPQIPQVPQFPAQIPQIPQIPQFNAFPAQPQFAVTTSPVVQSTMVTQTNSKILKLTFGARTAQTTIFSTTVIPTTVTTYVTASIPVAPTAAAYPGYYPAPYPGYPYVG